MSNKVFHKDKLTEIIDEYLLKIKTERKGKTLYLVSKSLLNSGKKIRPLIFLNIVEARSFKLEGDIAKVAISIEMLHCASLIIDDLPSMDNDNFRRGEETIHVKYGVKKAQMIANKFIFESLKNILNICKSSKECKMLIFEQLKRASMGQFFDMKGVSNSDNNEMSNVINMKTAPFFNIAFILAGFFTEEGYENYIILGDLFSAMFQICDDVEDYTKDLQKNHTMNHCILMGKEKSYDLYIKNRDKFVKKLHECKLYLPYFIFLIELLDKKMGLDL